MDKEKVTKEILATIGNKNTKVEVKEDFKGNYYSYITDTIYIAKHFNEQQKAKATKDINENVAEIIVLSHECVHSMQNKKLHLSNTIFSNLSIAFALFCICMSIFSSVNIYLKATSIVILIISIVIRLILEMGAIKGSIEIANKYINNNETTKSLHEDIVKSKEYINKHKVFVLLTMVLDKIIYLTIIIFIN